MSAVVTRSWRLMTFVGTGVIMLGGGWGAPVVADTAKISGGGHLEGATKTVASGKQKFVVVADDDDIQIALLDSNVTFLSRTEELGEYRKRVAAVGDDSEGNYQLARWCSSQNLSGQRNFHYHRAIDLDPNHVRARKALGYTLVKGNWIPFDVHKRSQGLVKSGAKWQVPAAVAIEKANDEANKRAKRWNVDLGRLRVSALKGSGEALAEIRAIDDPLAAGAVAKELVSSRKSNSQSRSFRLMWVEILGRFRNAVSVQALTLAGVDEPDDLVREQALEELRKYGSDSAVGFYLQLLRSNDNGRVRAGAQALAFFPNPELAFSYVDALQTEHVTVTQAGPGTQAGFSQTGGNSFTSGSKATKVSVPVRNPAVLGLIKMIEPAVDYGYDEDRWRRHFAAKINSYHGPLRSDP